MKSYPEEAGWKDPGPSRQNAIHVERSGKAQRLRQRVLALFTSGFEGTADDVAKRLGEDSFSIRPRCTELIKLNSIERLPIRRRGAGGGTAAVLRLKPDV